ncbi:MAG: nucleotide sugar dehydrogenase [Verrucomicrobia bacterium]|nr:nucleotide sugar dehydrogenase [Verrucomicrobiota bacterium]
MKTNQLEQARSRGQEIVAVVGLGFVGTAVAANLARAAQDDQPLFFVVGVDLDTPDGRDKCARVAAGKPPVYAGDPSLNAVYQTAALTTGNLAATVDPAVFAQVDVVVVCINLDLQREPGQTERLHMHTDAYARTMREIGSRIRLNTLVAVESTLPIGMCDTVLYPALCEGQRDQGLDPLKSPPLLAFCYERVMPGPDYLDSVNNFWRAFGGMNAASNQRARAFMSKFVNVTDYPLWEHKSTRAAETAKLLENAYRATNIAFIQEWATIAETTGVDLFDVIASIRVRKGTHDNMMRPGLGVGGYCLTKDALLAAYGVETLLKQDAALPFSRMAILTNERMPLLAVNWIRDHFDNHLQGRKVALLGVTYRPQVADTRHSASQTVALALMDHGANVFAYDPLVDDWHEAEGVQLVNTPTEAVRGSDAVVICLPDLQYRDFLDALLTTELSAGAIVVDPWNLLEDSTITTLAAAGITTRIYGRGDLPPTEGSA